jgi:methylthioribose-1-phosphate isomerase
VAPFQTLAWQGDSLRVLDQRRLPHRVAHLTLRTPREVAEAIREMAIRGAPAIGAAAAFGLALAAVHSTATDNSTLLQDLHQAADELRGARPTAVNLAWGLDRVLARVPRSGLGDPQAMRQAVVAEAISIAAQDAAANRQLALHGLALIPEEANILHHCNTGSLATVEYGTALGIIRAAHENGKRIHVYVDETRPRLQGARLTAWELGQLGIPHTVIVDSAAAHLMKTRRIDLCLVGCDRMAANGDTANKIGTYALALAAKAHAVPFYVAAPTSSIDLLLEHGNQIPIEERPDEEISVIGGKRIPPKGTRTFNPAFDVTPARLITAIVTERGIAYPPFEANLPRPSVE